MHARLALARLSLAAAVVAALWGGVHTWRALGREHVHLTGAEAATAAPRHERLPLALFATWRLQARRGVRWWLSSPPGRAEGLTTRRGVYLAYATFDLLPATPATSRRDATVVFHLAATR